MNAAEYTPIDADKLADALLQGIALKVYTADDDYIRDAAAMLRRLAALASVAQPPAQPSAVEAMREAAATLCDRFVSPYGRAGSAPDAVKGAFHRMAVAIRALPIPAAEGARTGAGYE